MGLFDFLAIGKAVRSAVGQIRDLRAEIEQLRRRRDELSTAPTARSDVKDEFARYLTTRAGDFNTALQKAAAALAAPAMFGKLSDPNPVRDANFFGLSDRVGGQHPVDALLAALVPDLINALFAQAVDNAPWPGPEGLPRVERAAAIAQLDDQIARLLTQERELIATARSAGLLIPET